jgi:uncharacterized OsmC-like protein
MAQIRVSHLAGDAFSVDVRGHSVVVDQPSHDFDEAGPTPVELFVASLASCVAFYATRFLSRRGLPYEGVDVECDWTMRAGEPARVGRITLRVTPRGFLPHELREPLRAAIERCTVHNSLREPPQVTIDLEHLPQVNRAA